MPPVQPSHAGNRQAGCSWPAVCLFLIIIPQHVLVVFKSNQIQMNIYRRYIFVNHDPCPSVCMLCVFACVCVYVRVYGLVKLCVCVGGGISFLPVICPS